MVSFSNLPMWGDATREEREDVASKLNRDWNVLPKDRLTLRRWLERAQLREGRGWPREWARDSAHVPDTDSRVEEIDELVREGFNFHLRKTGSVREASIRMERDLLTNRKSLVQDLLREYEEEYKKEVRDFVINIKGKAYKGRVWN